MKIDLIWIETKSSTLLLLLFILFLQLGEEDASNVTVLEYKPRDQIAIKFSKNLKAGQKCNLILEYSASLSNNYNGFYNSSYTDKDGIKRYKWRHMKRSKRHELKNEANVHSWACSVQRNLNEQDIPQMINCNYGCTQVNVMHCYYIEVKY